MLNTSLAPWLFASGFSMLFAYIAYYDWRDGKVYLLPLIPLFFVAYIRQLSPAGDIPTAVISMLFLGGGFLFIFMLGQIGMGDVLLNMCVGLWFTSLYQTGVYLVAITGIGVPYVLAWYLYYYYYKDYEPKGMFGLGGFVETIPVDELTTDMILNNGHFIKFTDQDDVEQLQQRGGNVQIAHRWPGVPLMLAAFIFTFIAFHL